MINVARITPAVFLLMISIFSSILLGADVSKLTFYRLSVPLSVYELSHKLGNDSAAQRGMLLAYFLKKDECSIEKVGEAAIFDGKFTLDQLYDVHFFLEGKDGEFSINTSPRKAGHSFSGTIKSEAGHYIIDVKYIYSYIKTRAPLGFAKNLAPDLQVGLPNMTTETITVTPNALPGIPAQISGVPHQDPKKFVLTFLVLE